LIQPKFDLVAMGPSVILAGMQIGIDARLAYYRSGGITQYTRHVVQELAGLDQATGYAVIHHYRSRETLKPGPNFRRINTFTPCHHRLERWSLSLELLRHRLDLLHSPDFIPPVRGARRQVITVESLRYYKNQIAWAVQRADHILVPSHATQDDLGNLLQVPAEKITVHIEGVDDIFRPLADEIVAQHRARLGLPESYILFVGTLEPRKNIPGLLEAYALLRQELADAPPLVLVGNRGWLYDEIFAKVETLDLVNRVIWLENAPTADLPLLYNGAGVLVLPSYYEGFGLTALEAMACGTPAVVARRSSLPEVVGGAGLLVDPDNPADIAEGLRQILCDSALRNRLRSAGLARAAAFTWQQAARSVLQVYRQLLSF
jgi:glycosyltransferase involved in cell wall biosynthesis